MDAPPRRGGVKKWSAAAWCGCGMQSVAARMAAAEDGATVGGRCKWCARWLLNHAVES